MPTTSNVSLLERFDEQLEHTITEKNVYKSLRTLVLEEMGECRSGQVPQCDHDEYDISRDEAAATDQHDYEEAVRDDEQQVWLSGLERTSAMHV